MVNQILNNIESKICYGSRYCKVFDYGIPDHASIYFFSE